MSQLYLHPQNLVFGKQGDSNHGDWNVGSFNQGKVSASKAETLAYESALQAQCFHQDPQYGSMLLGHLARMDFN